jgi:hypothetical protein
MYAGINRWIDRLIARLMEKQEMKRETTADEFRRLLLDRIDIYDVRVAYVMSHVT